MFFPGAFAHHESLPLAVPHRFRPVQRDGLNDRGRFVAGADHGHGKVRAFVGACESPSKISQACGLFVAGVFHIFNLGAPVRRAEAAREGIQRQRKMQLIEQRVRKCLEP